MERREACLALEDELQSINWNTKKAHCLLMELVDDYFFLSDDVQGEWGISQLRDGYARACVKAEIARDLLGNVRGSLESLLLLE